MQQRPRPSFGGNRGRNPNFRREQQQEHRTNRMIRVPEVRLVGENIEVGVYKTEEALRMAEEQGLDLVEISPNAVPPFVGSSTTINSYTNRKRRKRK